MHAAGNGFDTTLRSLAKGAVKTSECVKRGLPAHACAEVYIASRNHRYIIIYKKNPLTAKKALSITFHLISFHTAGET